MATLKRIIRKYDKYNGIYEKEDPGMKQFKIFMKLFLINHNQPIIITEFLLPSLLRLSRRTASIFKVKGSNTSLIGLDS